MSSTSIPLSRVLASHTHHESDPALAVDGKPETFWDSGRSVSFVDSPVWIQIDLGSEEYIEVIRIRPYQSSQTDAVHEVALYDECMRFVVSTLLTNPTPDGSVIEIDLPHDYPGYKKARHIRVSTYSSPAPVRWREIQAHRGRSPRGIIVPPHPGGGIVTPQDDFALLLDESVVLFEDHSLWYAPPSGRPTLLDANPRSFGIAKNSKGHVYQMHDDGSVYRYEGRPGWTRMSDASKAVAMTLADDDVYRMAQSGVVEWYDLGNLKWEAIDQMYSAGGGPPADTSSQNLGFTAQEGGYVWLLRPGGQLFRGGRKVGLQLIYANGAKQVSSYGKNVYLISTDGAVKLFLPGTSGGFTPNRGYWMGIDHDPKNVAIFSGPRPIVLRSDGSFLAYNREAGTTIPITEGDVRAAVASYQGDLKSRFEHELDQLKASATAASTPEAWAMGSAVVTCGLSAAAAIRKTPALEAIIPCLFFVTYATVLFMKTNDIKKQTANGQLPNTPPRPFEGHDTKTDPSHGTPQPNGSGHITVCMTENGEEHCVSD